MCRVTIFFERKSWTNFGGGDGMKDSRKEHIYKLETDHTYSLNVLIGKLAGWCSRDTIDLYSGGYQVRISAGTLTILTEAFRTVPQSLQVNAGLALG
jgi:hypothetical protein